MEKKRINVYLEQKIVELAHLETDNVSELVNNLLESYLSVSTTSDVDEEIKAHEKAITILKEKKKSLLLAGVHESKEEGMQEKLLDELRVIYKIRRETAGDNKDGDFEWISSPKNLQRCKVLCREPIVMITELRDWIKNNGGNK
jgi:hypothetical protein